jgi:hypothetical protein
MNRPAFLLCLIILAAIGARAQQVPWEWARGTTHAQTRVLSVDRIGNIHGVAPYEKNLAIGDTLFSHNSYYSSYPYYNQALFQYDRHGKFMKAADIRGIEGQGLTVTSEIADPELKIHAGGNFLYRFFIDDTIITHGKVPYLSKPDAFLLNLDRDYHHSSVELVSGFYQDDCLGLENAGGGDFIMATEHSSLFSNTTGQSPFFPNNLVVLGPDTLKFSDSHRTLICRRDRFGDLKWVSSLTCLEYGTSSRFISGGDGMFCITGYAVAGIVLGEDTIRNPYNISGNYQYPFFARISSDGIFHKVSFLPWRLPNSSSTFAADGSIYFSGGIVDSIQIGSETVRVPADSASLIILRVDSTDQVAWYRLLTIPDNTIYWSQFYQTAWHDSVWFTFQCPGTFSFAGHSYANSDSGYLFTGMLGPDGILYHENLTGPAYQVKPNSILADRCGNVVIGGVIESDMVFGSDTIHTPLYNDMGFIAKLRIHPPGSIELGPDTAACARYTIQGPPGYAEYCWSNGAGWSQDLTVTKSGMYHLQVSADGNCWSEDSVFVLIREKPASGMTDTAVAFHDSIILKVPSHYDSYLWSTGSTADSILVKGTDLPPTGKALYWIDMVKGVCETRDTFYISRKNNIGIEETGKDPFSLYPNPAGNSIAVRAADPSGSPADIRIYDIRGILVHHEATTANPCRIDLSGDSPGIYIVRIIRDNLAWTGRFVKN